MFEARQHFNLTPVNFYSKIRSVSLLHNIYNSLSMYDVSLKQFSRFTATTPRIVKKEKAVLFFPIVGDKKQILQELQGKFIQADFLKQDRRWTNIILKTLS